MVMEMNMHGPSEEAQCELLELAAVSHQIISPANNQSIVGIFKFTIRLLDSPEKTLILTRELL